MRSRMSRERMRWSWLRRRPPVAESLAAGVKRKFFPNSRLHAVDR